MCIFSEFDVESSRQFITNERNTSVQIPELIDGQVDSSYITFNKCPSGQFWILFLKDFKTRNDHLHAVIFVLLNIDDLWCVIQIMLHVLH